MRPVLPKLLGPAVASITFSFVSQMFIDIVIIPKFFSSSDVYIVKVFFTTLLFFNIVPGVVTMSDDSFRQKLIKNLKWFCRKCVRIELP